MWYNNSLLSYLYMSDKFVLSIPSNIEDITLEQYQKYLKITNELDKEADNDDFIAIKLLEIFCDASYDNIRRLPASIYEVAVAKVLECLNEKTPMVKHFTMRGNDGVGLEFGMIPNLHNMSSGEYIDLDSLIGDFDNMHKAMAVLYRPVIKKHKELYDIEPYETYEKYEEIMKHTPLNVALGAMLFFYRLGIKLSKHTLNSSLKQLTKEEAMQVEKNLLGKSGVGINQFMQSLEVTYSSLMRLQTKEYTSV